MWINTFYNNRDTRLVAVRGYVRRRKTSGVGSNTESRHRKVLFRLSSEVRRTSAIKKKLEEAEIEKGKLQTQKVR